MTEEQEYPPGYQGATVTQRPLSFRGRMVMIAVICGVLWIASGLAVFIDTTDVGIGGFDSVDENLVILQALIRTLGDVALLFCVALAVGAVVLAGVERLLPKAETTE